MDVKYFQLSTLSKDFYLQVITGSSQRLFIEYNTLGEKIKSSVWLDYHDDIVGDIECIFEDISEGFSVFEIEPCLWPYIINKK